MLANAPADARERALLVDHVQGTEGVTNGQTTYEALNVDMERTSVDTRGLRALEATLRLFARRRKREAKGYFVRRCGSNLWRKNR